MDACDLLAVEHRLDRVEAVLASELPPHVRALARSYARGEPPPAAPELLHRPATLATARAALAHPLLADRGLALLRLVVPLAIEREVAVAYALPATWATLTVLAAARDAAAHARFGRRAIELLHALHGSHQAAAGQGADDAALPAPIAAWTQPDGVVVDDAAIARAWAALRAQHAVDGAVRFDRAAVRSRCFVVAPGAEVIVVLPAQIATPADRFAVLHELGHAVAALGLAAGIPRVVDEAAAGYVARGLEVEGAWYSPHAAAARQRRRALAALLDRIERALPAITERPAERPPWALWHDPGAQAAYVAAEAMADALAAAIGPAPAPSSSLIAALTAQRAAIDRVDLGI